MKIVIGYMGFGIKMRRFIKKNVQNKMEDLYSKNVQDSYCLKCFSTILIKRNLAL